MYCITFTALIFRKERETETRRDVQIPVVLLYTGHTVVNFLFYGWLNIFQAFHHSFKKRAKNNFIRAFKNFEDCVNSTSEAGCVEHRTSGVS